VLACLLFACALAGAASAAEPFDGRWGACEAGPTLLVTSLSLRWRDAACAIRRSYLVGDAWHIGARCLAEGVAADIPIRLELRGGRLLLDWAGAPPEELRRCP
jgi:hypothetical protein